MTKPTKSTKGSHPAPDAPRPEPAAEAARPARPRKPKGVAAAGGAAPRAKESPAAPAETATPTPQPPPPTASPREIAAALNAATPSPDASAPDAPADSSAPSPPPPAPAAGAPDARPITAAATEPTVPATLPEASLAEREHRESDGPDAAAATAPEVPFAERVRLRSGVVELLVFRVGTELFAAALPAIEEALELPSLSHLPEMPPSMLGVISLRGRMLPAYSPARPLGVALARADAAALVVRAGERRVALAVDDVDDVLTLDLSELRPAPTLAGEERDAVLLGVAARGSDLVAVLDADALVTACLSDQALEIA